MDKKKILDKYEDVVKEELNVKQIDDLNIETQIIYKPLGSKLSKKFGKDTGKIIMNGKKGNLKLVENNAIKVLGENGEEWILENDEYEIEYSGLEGNNFAYENDLIIKMETELTEELKQEGIAREISRFLNQMRKEADYNVDDRIDMFYFTDNETFKNSIKIFEDFLKSEALLKSITKVNIQPGGDIVALFELDGKNIEFGLKK